MSVSLYKGIAHTIRREWKQMLSRPIFFVSSVLVMLFCYLFFLTFLEGGKPTELPAGVVDLDQSYVSRTFIRNLDASPQTRIIKRYNSYTEAREDLQRGDIFGFLVIGKNFEKELLSYRRPEITLYASYAYLNAGSLLMKDMTYMSAMGSAYVQMRVMEAKGADESRMMGLVQPVTLDAHLIANPWLDYGIYLLTMLLPGVLQLMVVILTIFTIGGELKERKGRQWLKTANRSMFAALTGKMIPYTLLFTILGIVGNLILFNYMHYPMHGSIFVMFMATFLLVISSQAVGIFIIGLFPVLSDALSIGAFFGLLGLTFAGFTFPVEGMPSGVQIFSNLFPMRHYFRVYVNEALNGADFRYSLVYFAVLLAFSILPALVYYRLKKAAIFSAYPKK